VVAAAHSLRHSPVRGGVLERAVPFREGNRCFCYPWTIASYASVLQARASIQRKIRAGAHNAGRIRGDSSAGVRTEWKP
jgi:hypothetical protein